MLKNYLKVAFRSLIRSKAFSLINIIGLATGLTSALLILTFVVDEYSYDQFHQNKERIYRLRYFISDFDIGRVPPIFKENLNDFFPEVENSSRLWSRSVSIKVPNADGTEQRFEETNVNFADPELFNIFSFELVSGSLSSALSKPYTVVLNEEIARKYFNSTDVIGKNILMEGSHSFQVIAVVKDFPENSHAHFDMLVPYENMYDLEPVSLQEGLRDNFKRNWMISHSPTYVLLKAGADPQEVNKRFVDFVKEKIPENQQKGQSFQIQPLLDIHLNDAVGAQAEPSGSKSFIHIFIAVGILTLLIACINFINLSTAKSLQRAKEIGMRRVMGAINGNLVSQFMGESLLTTVMAAMLSIGATILLMPYLNLMTNKELNADIISQPNVLIGYILIVLITSILAGIYPSFFVTRFSLLKSLKGGITDPTRTMNFRKVLMIVQFTISIVLMAGALIVFDQLQLLRNKPLGFQKKLIINVPVQSANFNSVLGGGDAEKRQIMNAFEEAIAAIPGVRGSTVSDGVPGFGMVNRNVIPEGFTAEDNMLSPVMAVDYDFLDVYEIELASGRSFDQSFGTDLTNAFIINETAVKSFDFGDAQSALGKTINMEGKQGKVIGVARDFNFLSLSEAMRPLIMQISEAQFGVFSIKLENLSIPNTLDQIEMAWNKFFPSETFAPEFLDESLDQNYESQEQFGRLIGYFSILAIVISCLGSYGLILFIAAEKRKEVGVRKVLGATISQLVLLLSRRFVGLVIIAIVLAVPLIIYAANLWLEDYSYRVNISALSILYACVLTIFLVFFTVSIQAIKSAIANPVESLRSE